MNKNKEKKEEPTAGSGLSDWLGTSPVLLECAVAALLTRCEELKYALGTAKEAMDERRSYADGWEWKYGKAWDAEDAKVKAELERA